MSANKAGGGKVDFSAPLLKALNEGQPPYPYPYYNGCRVSFSPGSGLAVGDTVVVEAQDKRYGDVKVFAPLVIDAAAERNYMDIKAAEIRAMKEDANQWDVRYKVTRAGVGIGTSADTLLAMGNPQ